MNDPASTKKAWLITILLFFFMMINFADKAIVGLAGASIMADLNLTPKEFGLVGSSFFLLFSLSAVVTGFVVNRIHTKSALLVMGLVWALTQFPMVGTVGLSTLIACRIALGAGEGPAYPVALHAVYKWFPDAKRAVPGAVVAQGAALGVVISVPILNWIITHYSWHYAFGALGLAGLVWAAVWALLGAEGPVVDAPQVGAPTRGGRGSYRPLLLSATNLASWGSYFGAYFALALGLAWFTPYLMKSFDFPQAQAGKITALLFVIGFVVIMFGSWLSALLTRRGVSSRWARGVLSGVFICVGAVALIALPHAATPMAKIALVIIGTTLPPVIMTLSPAILSEITPTTQRGAVLAINSAVGTSAGIIAPYLMGSIIEGAASAAQGYEQGYVVCGYVALVGGVIALLFLGATSKASLASAGSAGARAGSLSPR